MRSRRQGQPPVFSKHLLANAGKREGQFAAPCLLPREPPRPRPGCPSQSPSPYTSRCRVTVSRELPCWRLARSGTNACPADLPIDQPAASRPWPPSSARCVNAHARTELHERPAQNCIDKRTDPMAKPRSPGYAEHLRKSVPPMPTSPQHASRASPGTASPARCSPRSGEKSPVGGDSIGPQAVRERTCDGVLRSAPRWREMGGLPPPDPALPTANAVLPCHHLRPRAACRPFLHVSLWHVQRGAPAIEALELPRNRYTERYRPGPRMINASLQLSDNSTALNSRLV